VTTAAAPVGSRERMVSAAVLCAAVLLVGMPAISPVPMVETTLVAAVLVWVLATYRQLLRWDTVLAATMCLVLFIPTNRYALPFSGPIELDPYRLWVLLALALWIASLLVVPHVRLRSSGFEGPVLVVAAASFASIGANLGHVSELGVETDVVRRLSFLASFVLVFYLIASLVRTKAQIDSLMTVLAAGGAVVAVSALFEARTGYNVFSHLSSVIPILEPHVFSGEEVTRGGRVRAYASAENSLALGALLAMLVPVALYVALRTKQVRWWIALGVLAISTLATGSRTSVVMCLVAALVFLWLRPMETRRLWPLLLPALIAVHFALPGSLGSFKKQFFPEGGLVAQQSKHPGWDGSGRIADLSPGITEWKEKPLLGQGYGTRVTNGPNKNALVLDDQWLKSLIETGLVGVLGWLWLFLSFLRRAGKEAKRDSSERGWLLASLTASTTSFAVGMIFFDAFSFLQVTFLLFVLLALGAVALRLRDADAPIAGIRGARRA
jgi:polysaccharide biosynthesis protein PslJ